MLFLVKNLRGLIFALHLFSPKLYSDMPCVHVWYLGPIVKRYYMLIRSERHHSIDEGPKSHIYF